VKIFVLEMKRATGKEIAEQVIRPTKVIPLAVLRLDVRNCSSLYRLWKVLKRVEEREKRRERRMVGMRMILVLM